MQALSMKAPGFAAAMAAAEALYEESGIVGPAGTAPAAPAVQAPPAVFAVAPAPPAVVAEAPAQESGQ